MKVNANRWRKSMLFRKKIKCYLFWNWFLVVVLEKNVEYFPIIALLNLETLVSKFSYVSKYNRYNFEFVFGQDWVFVDKSLTHRSNFLTMLYKT